MTKDMSLSETKEVWLYDFFQVTNVIRHDALISRFFGYTVDAAY